MTNTSVTSGTSQPELVAVTNPVQSVVQTTCCIVGAGAAGSVLALLLARQGIPVTLLEKHQDFERQFRGDSLHPSVMEVMDEMGVADRLLQLHHTKVSRFTVQTPLGPYTPADFSHLKTRFPYISLLPQSVFLQFITDEAKCYPNFQLIMGANVKELIEDCGEIRGVRYQGQDGWQEVRALLTVGADGRSSRVRELAGLEPIKTSAPMDVLWFRLARVPGDPEGPVGRIGNGHLVAMLDRSYYWQVGYVIRKGGYQQLREAGLQELRRSIAGLVPEFADRLEEIRDWDQIALLTVESSRLPRWYRPGLLLIGDAAHVMTPVGGVGINYAIQDVVVAANVLGEPLRAGRLQLDDLAAVQRRREWPTRIIQTWQNLLQRQILVRVLDPTTTFTPPLLIRLPVIRSLFARGMGRLVGFGVWPVHLKGAERRRIAGGRREVTRLIAVLAAVIVALALLRSRRPSERRGSVGSTG